MTDRPTLRSVAYEAGVSPQTVSNALNNPDLLHPETLVRVLDTVERLRYRPRRAARALRTSRSYLVGVGLRPAGDGIGGVVLDRFLHALTESAGAAGYHVLLFDAADTATEIAAYDDLLATHDLDALVLTSTHHGDERTAWLAARSIPFVTFGRPWGGTAQHSWVDVDGAAGTREVTRHLLAAGHRRIAFVGWPSGSGVGDDRLAGWASAMAAAGAPTGGLLVQRDDGATSGRRALQELHARGPAPTAVVCASDALALGVVAELAAQGTPAGPALPVVGFDDTPVASALGLTSLAQPLAAAAAACARLLVALLEPDRHDVAQPAHVLLPPHLVVRSTGAAPVPLVSPSAAPHGAALSHPEGAP